MSSAAVHTQVKQGRGPAAPARAPQADAELRLLVKRFLGPLLRLSGAQGGAVRILAEASDLLRLVGSQGRAARDCRGGAEADRHCGFCGDAADGLQLVWATDLSPCATAHGAAPASRMLTLPLRHRERVLGVCNLYFAHDQAPAPEVQTMVESVGELLGLALDNARLNAENLEARLTRERQMMAAELHDSLAQSLTFVKMRMPLLSDAMQAHDDARAQQYLSDVRSEVTQAHASLRSLLTHFRTPMDPQGLVHALDASAAAFRRSTATELDFVNDLPDLQLAPAQETHVFHIVQEALTNVAKHAAASHVRLHIGPARAGEIEVVVEDDGTGLTPAAPAAAATHYGLDIMTERARHIGGTLDVGRREGGGTRVRLAFPLTAAARAGASGDAA